MSEYLSKSLVRDMGCPLYFAGIHLSRNAIALHSPEALTGTQFHHYKAMYINHLVTSNLTHDHFYHDEITSNPAMELTDDALELIKRDRNFQIDPERVLATELYLGVDEKYAPVERRENFEPGTGPRKDRTRLGGTIDLIELDDDRVIITDWKTTYSSLNAEESESAIYSLLAFQHFPNAKTVTFCWSYIRLGVNKSVTYDRNDIGWIMRTVERCFQSLPKIKADYESGIPLNPNPSSGLCHYCTQLCPLQKQIMTGELNLPIIQNQQDAVKVAQTAYMAKVIAEKAEAALKTYLTDHGPLEIGSGYAVKLNTQVVNKQPLKDALQVLGITIPENTPEYDIPTNSLTIGGLHGFAKAKKRAGLKDRLGAIAKQSSRTVLNFVRDDDLPLLPEADE